MSTATIAESQPDQSPSLAYHFTSAGGGLG